MISVVVPVYNSEKTIAELVNRLTSELKRYDSFEIFLVNDGSRDNVLGVCKSLATQFAHVKVISFYRNFGQISALMCGLSRASGDVCVIIDDDLQYLPEDIHSLISPILSGSSDFVFGISPTLQYSLFRNATSKLVQKINVLTIKKPSEIQTSSFLAFSKQVNQAIVQYDGPFPHIAGLIFRITANGQNVTVTHHGRSHGRSQYRLRKLILLWLSSVTNFSIFPLRLSAGLGFLMAVFGFLSIAAILVKHLFWGHFMSGWASTISLFMMFSGVQMIALGLIGEYVGRTYMILNKTPLYAVKETYNIDGNSAKPMQNT